MGCKAIKRERISIIDKRLKWGGGPIYILKQESMKKGFIKGMGELIEKTDDNRETIF